MIDKADKKTQDAFPRRGRPATGNAMTAAERKRAQRQRATAQVWGTPLPDYSAVPTSMLIESLTKSVSDGFPSITQAIAKELVKRAKKNSSD